MCAALWHRHCVGLHLWCSPPLFILREPIQAGRFVSGDEGQSTKVQQRGLPLKTFDFAFQPAIARSRIATPATGTSIRNSKVVLMQGPAGAGKSHLLCGLGIRAIQLGFPTRYFRCDKLLTALRWTPTCRQPC
jgi:hypothetical protein